MPLGTEGLLSVVLETAGILTAAWGALRVGRLNHTVGDPRLARLGLFFGLIAASLLASASGTVALELRGVTDLREGFELLDLLFWARHALLAAAILVGIRMVHPAPAVPPGPGSLPVLAPLLIAAEPILALAEGLGFLYLTARTALNHLHRASVGSLEVSLGFAFLLAASVLSLALSPLGAIPLGPPLVWSAGLELVAVLLFHGALPGRKGQRRGVGRDGPAPSATARGGPGGDPTGRAR